MKESPCLNKTYGTLLEWNRRIIYFRSFKKEGNFVKKERTLRKYNVIKYQSDSKNGQFKIRNQESQNKIQNSWKIDVKEDYFRK